MKLTDSEFQEKVTAIMAAPERQETEKQNEGEGEKFTIKYLNYENLKTLPEDVLGESSITKLYLKRNLLKTLVFFIYL